MSFTSLVFALFVAAVLVSSAAVRWERRWAVLLAASVAFLAVSESSRQASPWLAAGALAVSSVLVLAAFWLGRLASDSRGSHRRRAAVWTTSGMGVAALVALRPSPLHSAVGASLVVPLGLSFLVLRLVGYVLDVSRGHVAPERHLGRFAAFAFLFAELPAGPIERAARLLPQLRQPAPFQYGVFSSGIRLCAWGLFKKLVVADRIRPFVAAAYDEPGGAAGVGALVATVLFAFEIYCDFSGYSDIALGVGRLFGLELAQNFDRPYLATSVVDFWSRWHISLSTWLRDIVFLPMAYRASRLEARAGERALQSKRHGPSTADLAAYALASTTTMALCGLWHGLRATYLVWGLVMAAMLTTSVATRRVRRRMARRLGVTGVPRVHTAARVALTFTLVAASWVVFRANSLAQASQIFRSAPAGLADFVRRAAATLAGRPPTDVALRHFLLLGQTTFELLIVLAGIAIVMALEAPWGEHTVASRVLAAPRWIRWPAYIALTVTIVVFRAPDAARFIYQGF